MILYCWKVHLKAGETVEVPHMGTITVPTSGPYTVTVYTEGRGGITGVEVSQDWDDEVLEWETEAIDPCDEDFMRSIST